MAANTFRIRLASKVHRALYAYTGGRIGGRLGRLPVLLLTTMGHRSSRSRTVPLVYLQDGEDLVLIGSYGGNDKNPAWVKNLETNQHAAVQIRTKRRQVVASTATGEERERLWEEVVKLWPGYARYQQQTQRLIPLVVLRATAK